MKAKPTKRDRFNRPIVPCKICGRDTVMVATKLCDPCWEVRSMFRSFPIATVKVVRAELEELDVARRRELLDLIVGAPWPESK